MTFCQSDPLLGQVNDNTQRGLTPSECSVFKVSCKCYGSSAQAKIFKAITDLEKCQIDLNEKSLYVQTRLVTWGAGQPVAFWQEPSWVISGMVVSASIGAALGAYLVGRGK